VRFKGTCYRMHDPRWAFDPTSGAGAAIHGGRFNRKGVNALYLALTLEGAFHEVLQGFVRKFEPLTMCSYEVDCDDIADLRTESGRKAHNVEFEALSGAWKGVGNPPSWGVADRLANEGFAGIIVPSFAVGARTEWANLVLWKWGRPPHSVVVHDPNERLPKDQSSWSERSA
jgi:RES domain-containing protein